MQATPGHWLKPVDFKKVAAVGCYVYCYLRTGNLKPYYVGIASNAQRPYQKHDSCTVPTKNRHLVRVMKSALTWEEACQWERFYIKRYGRKGYEPGGILLNQGEGGEGLLGYKHTEESRAIIRSKRATQVITKKMRAACAKTAKEILGQNEIKLKGARTKQIKAAQRWGICPAIYGAMSNREKATVRQRAHRGRRGDQLLVA